MATAQQINYYMNSTDPHVEKTAQLLKEHKRSLPKMRAIRIDARNIIEVPSDLSAVEVGKRILRFKKRMGIE